MSNGFFNTNAPAAPAAPVYAPPAPPAPAGWPAHVPVPQGYPAAPAPAAYGAPAPQAPRAPFDPTQATGVDGFIGADPINPGAHKLKLKDTLGQYSLKIVNASTANGYHVGPYLAIDFEITGSNNGIVGTRSLIFILNPPESQKRYRADEITAFLMALGVPQQSCGGAFKEVITNPLCIVGKTLRGDVISGRDPKYNEVKFSQG